jgi:sarcosine oxidase subunit gamma
MVEIAEIRGLVRFVLRGAGPFAVPMPVRPLQSLPVEGGDALWLGPDEWLILVGESHAAALAEAIARTETPYALVDVTHRQIALRLTGADAEPLLNGGVPLDLSLRTFPIGGCTRTLFEKAEIVLWRRAAHEWRLDVGRSFAPYVRDMLAAIAKADGLALSA